MKRTVQLNIIFLVTFGLASCGIVGRQTGPRETPEQSKFKENFSIGTIIEAHEDLLIEAPRALSGMESGPREPFIQSQEYITMQVEQENIAVLMQIIQSDIQDVIIDSGAQQVGSGGSSRFDEIANFSYSYREGSIYGVVNVWGVRGEETDLVIIVQITESLD